MKNKWNLIPLFFIGLGILMVWMSSVRHKTQTVVNQAYLIDMVCVANEISPENRIRRKDYREYCYDQAEEMTGVKIRRFGL